MSPIWASAMLRTADKLAGNGAGQGRPAVCDLRRATSTAYYALFHQLTRHGSLVAVPSATEDEIAMVARWFTHTGIAHASRLVLTADSPKTPGKDDVAPVTLLKAGRGIPTPLVLVAETFLDLQQKRHEADYSNRYDPVRYSTALDVASAHAAVRETWSMWRARNSPKGPRQDLHDSYSRFLQMALLKSGGPRAR